ncbi:hypothetical protein C3L33_09610, partial [Rhododendron williamsianum]
MVTPPPIETTAAAKLIRPTVVADQANRRRPGHNGMAATATATKPTALAALPPPPLPGVASVDEFVAIFFPTLFAGKVKGSYWWVLAPFKSYILREYVYNRLSFSYGWYFTFVQGWVYIVLILLQGFTPKQMVNSWLSYWKLSAVLMGSNGLTKGSLAYLNYPAQIMFKSTKVNSGYNSLGLIKVLS